MPDLQDESGLAGNGASRVSEQRDSHSNDEPSPKDRKTSESDHPKKKRKVNHACVYCRRSHMTCDSDRPCKRCIKRNIGHLCHDEPREGHHRKSKSEPGESAEAESASPKDEFPSAGTLPGGQLLDDSGQPLVQDNSMGLRPTSNDTLPMANSGSMSQSTGVNGSSQAQFGYNEQWQPHFQDMHAYHPNFMFSANEVTDEYNLLNDFLSTSLLEEGGGMFSAEDFHGNYNDPSFMNSMAMGIGGNNGEYLQQMQPPQQNQNTAAAPNQNLVITGAAISRPSSTKPISDKAREKYYMTAADPAGNDPPEERMNKLLKAKYDAGLLKPFNYVNGYARLNKYMEKNMKHSSRHKILMQLDQFRPKFRERMQSLTDIELVLVEMWFERNLMEYDRVFASMAIPACCWRRTGEIFRGNKEMAELIHVPIESLRDGKLAIHEIIVEDQLVSYWEKFCAICFDQQQKAMLTSCTLRSPTTLDSPEIHCCFSFTIKRDNHNIPSLIVGNFLPMDPETK